MAIRIYRTPQQRDDQVEVSVDGETLTINGTAYDLAGVTDPLELDSDLVRGPVFRLNGDVHVLIVQAYGAGETPPEADEMPSYPAPEPTPDQISDRQFFQQMAIEERISQQEALDAVGSGVIPAAMDALVEQLPANQRFAARMLIRGATTFRRDHPVTELIGQLYGMTSEQIDTTWRNAAKL